MLNPQGEHYQDELFLDLFLKKIDVDFSINTKKCSVFIEYGNIDIYITDGNRHIIIENKIYAGDQQEQIKRYIENIKEENEKLDEKDILVIYLSLDRKQPSKKSLGELMIKDNYIFQKDKRIATFKSIHYQTEILGWLKECKYEVQNITNLNEVIKQYMDVVKILNNDYKEKVMKLEDELLQGEDKFMLARDIAEAYEKAKINIQIKFWQELQKVLKTKNYEFNFVKYNYEEKDIEKLVENYYGCPKKEKKEKYMYYGLKYDICKIDDNYTLSFYIEVDWNLSYGITIQENSERKELAQNENFKELSENILQSKETENDPRL